ncbi:hypothetical protein HAX54_015057 [Datura stramonium]|uniref:Uncharacterized protein n=1 Tax=Datura stramonium TaxID=4076 RepID=A0ABS8TQP1_DATST|nr:hypothetical protein [Datura stramonium]
MDKQTSYADMLDLAVQHIRTLQDQVQASKHCRTFFMGTSNIAIFPPDGSNTLTYVLDQLRRIKSGGDLSCVKIDQIEKLEMHLRFFRTFIKYHHVLLPNNSSYKMRRKAKRIIIMLYSVFGRIPDERETNLHVERLESQLLEFIEL